MKKKNATQTATLMRRAETYIKDFFTIGGGVEK